MAKKTKKIIENKVVRSVNKNVRSSTRKLNPILKTIVGKKVDIAIRDLTFSDKRISKDIKKTISSAIANAENNFQYDIDKLFVKEAYCGKQIIMKRFRARAKGRASPILKPYSNLTIILAEKEKEKVQAILLSSIDNSGFFEADVSKNNLFRDYLTKEKPYQINDKGMVTALDKPGIGLEVDETFLTEHPVIEGSSYV